LLLSSLADFKPRPSIVFKNLWSFFSSENNNLDWFLISRYSEKCS
jgi:hypothetical protein